MSLLILDKGNPQAELRRDDLALKLLAAFNGVTVEQLPHAVEATYFANSRMRDAWKRVADAARENLR